MEPGRHVRARTAVPSLHAVTLIELALGLYPFPKENSPFKMLKVVPWLQWRQCVTGAAHCGGRLAGHQAECGRVHARVHGLHLPMVYLHLCFCILSRRSVQQAAEARASYTQLLVDRCPARRPLTPRRHTSLSAVRPWMVRAWWRGCGPSARTSSERARVCCLGVFCAGRENSAPR